MDLSSTGSGSNVGRSESYPDISPSAKLLEAKDSVKATERSKRYKAREDNDPLKTELFEIRKQIGDMMSLLKTINETQTQKINQISDDICAIRHQVNSISKITDSLTTDQSNIKLEIKNIIKTNNDHFLKIETMEKRLNTIQTDNNNLEEIMAEINERDIRSKNLIIIGIPEPKSAGPKERQKSDINAVTEILKSANNEYPAPLTTFR